MKSVISHIAFFVSDLSRSTGFYRDVLQLPQIEEPFKMGMHSWFSLGGTCQLHLIAGAASLPRFHINHHLALSTQHFDAFLERLAEAGISYVDALGKPGKVHVRPDGIQQVFFKDPDGYWIEMNDDPIAFA